MMLIMPVTSAFEHCAGMDMSQLSTNQSFSITQSIDAANSLEQQKMLNESPMNTDCHSSGSCTLHACGAYAISASTPTLHIVTTSDYSIVQHTSHYSAVLTSDLRPPISIL